MIRRNTPRISVIGFGEAGQAIASGLREGGIEQVAAWDILFPAPEGARLKAAATRWACASRRLPPMRSRRPTW